ncbi:MAG: hypothetical protein ACJASV_000372 [Pseudorhodobacter sp.]
MLVIAVSSSVQRKETLGAAMTLSRRHFSTLLAASAMAPTAIYAQSDDPFVLLSNLLSSDPGRAFAGLDAIRTRGNPDLAAGVIQAMRFSNAPPELFSQTLKEITGANPGNSWFDWMLWQEQNPQVKPHPSFIDFKRDLFLRIDPNFDVFLKKGDLQPDRMKIRFEEITWGGVQKDGIPSLDNPTLVAAADASYMKGDDLIFGVSINGDTRAYPLRIMGWHEMFNETIGGVPVALAYCTLCGSGILFETKVEARVRPLIFGSSGFLYRSNKLMFDRATNSLWNQFTGKPVSGRLVDSGIELKQRPVVITTWDAWRAANPDTKILSLETGHRRDYGSGVVYNDYFASNDLMFPTVVDQSQFKQKDYVFGIRSFGGAKAWPLKSFAKRTVINDEMLDKALVLIGDEKTRTVRAFERGNLTFKTQNGQLQASDGSVWQVTEDALVSQGKSLPRVAGHIAYWFAWNGYLGAESELFEG